MVGSVVTPGLIGRGPWSVSVNPYPEPEVSQYLKNRHPDEGRDLLQPWIPAFAGMTREKLRSRIRRRIE
jgi:hypothetical protein